LRKFADMSFKSERTVRGRILSVLQKNEKLATEAAEKEFARAYAPVAAGVAAVTTCVTCVCVCESVCSTYDGGREQGVRALIFLLLKL